MRPHPFWRRLRPGDRRGVRRIAKASKRAWLNASDVRRANISKSAPSTAANADRFHRRRMHSSFFSQKLAELHQNLLANVKFTMLPKHPANEAFAIDTHPAARRHLQVKKARPSASRRATRVPPRRSRAPIVRRPGRCEERAKCAFRAPCSSQWRGRPHRERP